MIWHTHTVLSVPTSSGFLWYPLFTHAQISACQWNLAQYFYLLMLALSQLWIILTLKIPQKWVSSSTTMNSVATYLPTYLPGNHVLSYFQSPITLLQVCWQYKSEVLSTNSTLYNTTVQQFMQTSPLPLWRQKWKGAWPSCVITCMRNFQKSGQHWCMCEQALLSADQPPLSIRAWGVLYWHILRYRPDC